MPHFIRARVRDSEPKHRRAPSAARSDVTRARDTPQRPQFTARASCRHHTMAPAAPAATGAASPAVTKGGGKVAARSVRLGLPALPPLPGLSLAAQGQTRAASSLCE